MFPIRPFRSLRGPGLALFGLLACAGCSPSGPAAPPTSQVTSTAGPIATPSAIAPAGTGPASPPIRTTGPVGAVIAPAEACAQKAFGELTASQRAGQLVMAGVPAGDPGSYRTLVRQQRLGSVFLAGRTSDSPATIKRGLATLGVQKTKSTTIKPLVSVDQEGGKVQSLRGSAWTAIPSARTQGQWSTSKLTSRTRTWVKELRNAGITMDLAPVADTVPAGTEEQNPPIGYFGRQYGSTAAKVAADITTVTSTMQAGHVIPTIKHFPGLGRVRLNTDNSTGAVDRTTTVTSSDLTAFHAGIDAGAGAVMMSSASYPKIDKNQLAVFSAPVITDLLRGRMKYQGVVMTDDVGRAVAVKSVPRGQRATRFINAGGDLVLTVVPEAAPTMVAAIAAKARSSAGFRAKVNASTVRVLRLKQASGLLTCS